MKDMEIRKELELIREGLRDAEEKISCNRTILTDEDLYIKSQINDLYDRFATLLEYLSLEIKARQSRGYYEIRKKDEDVQRNS